VQLMSSRDSHLVYEKAWSDALSSLLPKVSQLVNQLDEALAPASL
jgi:hypothetical protein